MQRFFIPWVLAPIIVTAFNYTVMAIGLVPAPTGVSVPWTVPIFFSGMMATNSVLGGLLQIVDVVIVGFLWYPFLRVLDKQDDLRYNVNKSKSIGVVNVKIKV